MYNLKNGKGTFKGLIGECMLKLTRRNLILTRFFNRTKFFQLFNRNLTTIHKEFLFKNWYSIDALEWDYTGKSKKLILFEIKTENQKFNVKRSWRRPKMTLATHDMYNHALSLGFDVQVATVKLLDDWNYDIQLSDFSKFNYCIDKPKKYDRIN